MVNEAKAEIEELTVEQVAAEIEAGTAVVVDIRDIRERVEKGAIPGAISAPRGMLEFWFDPESPYHQDRYQPEGRYIFYEGHR
jgi:rhodanese-related sulfurtransferase